MIERRGNSLATDLPDFHSSCFCDPEFSRIDFFTQREAVLSNKVVVFHFVSTQNIPMNITKIYNSRRVHLPRASASKSRWVRLHSYHPQDLHS